MTIQTVGLDHLIKETGLDGKIVRRIIRKDFPELRAHGQKYQFNTETEAYKRIVEACKSYGKKVEKRESKPKREHTAEKIEWGGMTCPKCRGKASEKEPCKLCGTEGKILEFSVVSGKVWAPALIPSGPNIRESRPVYLGTLEEVTQILNGEKGIPDKYDHLSRLVLEEMLERRGMM